MKIEGCSDINCLIDPKNDGRQGTNGGCSCFESLPTDKKYFVKEKIDLARNYEKKLNEFKNFKEVFPEPFLTFICNILANGLIDVDRNTINDLEKEIEKLKKKYNI